MTDNRYKYMNDNRWQIGGRYEYIEIHTYIMTDLYSNEEIGIDMERFIDK